MMSQPGAISVSGFSQQLAHTTRCGRSWMPVDFPAVHLREAA
jgi:hypothetical protein